MNEIIAIVSLALSVYLVFIQITTWKGRVLLSPGFYFGFFWSFGLLGVSILHPVGLLIEVYPQYIDELNILVGFTDLCFILFTRKGKKDINVDAISMPFVWPAYKILSMIFLFAAIAELIRTGATLNMGASRSIAHDTIEGRSTIVGYAFSSAKILSILAGYKIVDLLMKKGLRANQIFWLIVPLVANLFSSIVVGGRVDFVYSFIYYLVGASFALPNKFSLIDYKKTIRLFAISSIIVLFFISWVASQREREYHGQGDAIELYLSHHSPLLRAIYGPIQYLVASYTGYQYRRVDAVDASKRGYGIYTLNGFINWTVPFGSQIGLGDFSIAKKLNFFYHNQETYDFQREFYYSTHSCYIPIIKDFGFWGALIFIFLLTLVSHILFVKIQCSFSIHHCYSLFLYFIFWNFWLKSNYYGSLSESVLLSLYPLLIVDMANYCFRNKR